jgi:hypothetical protein
MDEQTRVHKDIVMFEKNVNQIRDKTLTEAEHHIIDLAKQYFEDTKYYTEKQDFFTAFGCVNYAHGLLDAILKTRFQGDEHDEN